MALKIRMARRGTTNRPFYHIVVADSRAPRDGNYLEKLGTYNPLENDNTKRITMNIESIQEWMKKGALPSERVAKFLAQAGVMKAATITTKPIKSAPKKKAQERSASKAEKAAAVAEAAAAPAPATEAPAAEAPAASEEAAA